MADELLIRVYDVGLGDCIFCRIPKAISVGDTTTDFHMLIDCGTWSGMPLLHAALDDLEMILPDAGDGKKRLDLLVVTHEHKDHIAGCDPQLLARFKIGAIWMNAAMNPKHPQAAKTQQVHAFAMSAARSIAAQGLALSPELQGLVDLLAIDNAGAMRALRDELPRANGIEPTYVHAGTTHTDYDLPLSGATIHVLGPEKNIDHFYLGKAGAVVQAFAAMGGPPLPAGEAERLQPSVPSPQPENISPAEFRQLRTRMLSNALAFAALSSKVTNNSSVVLLVEWRGKRLLFVGDAEWDTEFKEGKSNGAWNVMWNQRKAALNKPLDFLKIGHHGSENATPWNDEGPGKLAEPAAILAAILPEPVAGAAPRAAAVVSTERGKYKTIPRAKLLVEIGRRVRNAQDYTARFRATGFDLTKLSKFEDFEEEWIGAPQPERTDLERLLTGRGFVDVIIDA